MGEMARSLMPFPWPGRVRTGSPVSTSRILICFGLAPATHSWGRRVVGFFVQTRLLKEVSDC